MSEDAAEALFVATFFDDDPAALAAWVHAVGAGATYRDLDPVREGSVRRWDAYCRAVERWLRGDDDSPLPRLRPRHQGELLTGANGGGRVREGKNAMASPTLWTAFQTFCDTVLRVGASHAADPQCTEQLREVLAPAQALAAAEGEPVLRAYFESPPSHVAAVNTLDHTLFANDLVFPTCSLSLRQMLGAFSHLPVAYGPLWLALLDVAQLANPQGVQTDAGRHYIVQQMAAGAGAGVVAAPSPGPAGPNLEGILGNILGAFPGLQDCVNKILANRDTGAPETDLNQVVHQVQTVLLGPVLESMKVNNPNGPDIGPAITQILAGFRGLNAAIATTASAPAPTDDAQTMDT